MIRQSPELLAVARRWYEVISLRDPGKIRDMLSKDAQVGFVGSAEGEIWFGPAVRQAVGDHFNEIPRLLDKKEHLAHAFENGETGWSFFHMEFHFETRPEPVHFHSLLIFVMEEGSWKIAFRQAAVPSPNLEVTGHQHSAIQALVEAAQQGFVLDQREGLASVMFTDIVGSSALVAALGDQAWSTIMSRHFAELRQIIEDQGGQFVKSMGDGTMSSFPSARRALSAAQEIQRAMAAAGDEPRLALRIGLHTGEVVQAQDDFFGSVVNKAARIAASAGEGDIRLSDVTRAMIGAAPEFDFDGPETVLLKGLDGEHRLYRLGWQGR